MPTATLGFRRLLDGAGGGYTFHEIVSGRSEHTSARPRQKVASARPPLYPRTMDKLCAECRRPARRLRRDRCDACYMRLYRNGEVPEGAACAACGERRRVVLTLVQLADRDEVVCGNCALLAERTRPRPASVDDVRRLSSRERRVIADRRVAARPVVSERRQGPRRASERRFEAPALDPSID